MKLTQHYWQPSHGNEIVRIVHKDNHTKVYMPGMMDPIYVIEGWGMEIHMTDLKINPTPKKIESVRVYDNL